MMSQTQTPPHSLVALGGTFDHFHRGHREFIKYAATLAPELIIGVTDQKLTTGKRYPTTVESVETRLDQVTAFCKQEGITATFPILHDVYGPTLTAPIDGLCITPETAAGAAVINRRRVSIGLPEVPVYSFPIVLDESGQPLHSDRIRAGEVDREGQTYASVLKTDLALTPTQRDFFTLIQGELIDLSQPLEPSPTLTVVVGDSSLETFITNGWQYDIGIFDHQRQRQPSESPVIRALEKAVVVDNPAGLITLALTNTLQQAIRNVESTQQIVAIQVNGEEDLAAVAAVLLLPLGSYVFYGQPNQGIVRMVVSEELKNRIRTALS